MSVRFVRLNNGDWGIKGPIEEIDTVDAIWVEKANGERTTVMLGKILKVEDGIAIASKSSRRRFNRKWFNLPRTYHSNIK